MSFYILLLIFLYKCFMCNLYIYIYIYTDIDNMSAQRRTTRNQRRQGLTQEQIDELLIAENVPDDDSGQSGMEDDYLEYEQEEVHHGDSDGWSQGEEEDGPVHMQLDHTAEVFPAEEVVQEPVRLVNYYHLCYIMSFISN